MSQRPALIVRRSHIVRIPCLVLVFWFSLAIDPVGVQAGWFCPANVNGDGTVNIDDLLAVVNAWGVCTPPCPPSCAADIASSSGLGVGDCIVNIDDLLGVINGWGPCTCPGGLTLCGGLCRDILNDPTFCGTTCENAVNCGKFYYCVGGVCTAPESPTP